MDQSAAPDRRRHLAQDARRFVHDLYAKAQADLDAERAEADFEREE
ncbi:hypothetical protein STANM309S_02684 [Streptomyces tanashiensis]